MLSSPHELHARCDENDIVLLQESLSARNELSLLSKTHSDFIGNGISSIDDELKLIVGRTFDGIGIMWRKTLNKHCTFKTYMYDCKRIAGLELNCDSFKTLFLCVCMPCDSGDNYDDVMFHFSKFMCLASAVANVADSDRCRCNPKMPSSIPAGGKDFP